MTVARIRFPFLYLFSPSSPSSLQVEKNEVVSTIKYVSMRKAELLSVSIVFILRRPFFCLLGLFCLYSLSCLFSVSLMPLSCLFPISFSVLFLISFWSLFSPSTLYALLAG